MATVIVKDRLSKGDFERAKEDYQSYIKITVDLKRKIIALGGEYHADAERLLLKGGSKQKDIWGGGVNLKTQVIDYNSLINTKPEYDNPSQEILSLEIRKIFERILKSKFNL